ncbi:MAG: aminotransferase class V-fold PLP-dependent enzyme [Candidatus Altiarchaeales archaeon]|nr:aminotransferase class V-fold PLP-dependent enzyme [Candidatus Altiarchaeales archaeon]
MCLSFKEGVFYPLFTYFVGVLCFQQVFMMAKSLFIPGPVDVLDDVARKAADPMVGHRSKEYCALHEKTVEGLRNVFMSENRIYFGPTSSTGFMEAAVRNCVETKALHVVNGAFSNRWHQISKSNDKAAHAIEIPWGSAGRPEDVKDELEAGDYDCLFVTHNETSTAVMTPLEGFSEVCRDNDVLFCVDAVSSMAGVPLPVDDLGIDVLVTGTQKCFGVAPGLAMTAVSDKAFQKSAKTENKGYYFDYHVFEKYAKKNNTPSTPPIPQIAQLAYQLDRILNEEGLENRYRRHREMAEHTRQWVRRHFEMYAEDWCASDTVTCAKNTRDADLTSLSAELGEKGYLFSNGYGKLKGQAFRVAHMADRQMNELKTYLDLIEQILRL